MPFHQSFNHSDSTDVNIRRTADLQLCPFPMYSLILSLPHSSIPSHMLPIDGEEVVEDDGDHGEGAEHVGEEVEGVMGHHLAAVKEWRSGLGGHR